MVGFSFKGKLDSGLTLGIGAEVVVVLVFTGTFRFTDGIIGVDLGVDLEVEVGIEVEVEEGDEVVFIT